MSRITPIHFRKFCKVLEKAGCTFSRQKGDHLIYHKKGALRAIVVPRWKELPIFIIKNNIKIADISRKEYFKFLRDVK